MSENPHFPESGQSDLSHEITQQIRSKIGPILVVLLALAGGCATTGAKGIPQKPQQSKALEADDLKLVDEANSMKTMKLFVQYGNNGIFTIECPAKPECIVNNPDDARNTREVFHRRSADPFGCVDFNEGCKIDKIEDRIFRIFNNPAI